MNYDFFYLSEQLFVRWYHEAEWLLAMSRVAASYEQLTQENVFRSWVFIFRNYCFILWVEVELLLQWVEVDLSKSILASLAIVVFSVYGIF